MKWLKKINQSFLYVFYVLCFLLITTNQGNAENVVYKYHKLLLEKIRNNYDLATEEKAWEEAKRIAYRYFDSIDIKKPATILVKEKYIDMERGIRGVYEKDLNIVIATDYKVLVHEYLHAIFYLSGDERRAGDESFIRSLYPDI